MKKITFLTAVLALFAFLALPLGMWGQTTVSYGWETSDDASQWTITSAITATNGEGNTGDFAGKINTNNTYVQFNEKVFVTSFSFAFKRTSNNNNYEVCIETSTDGNTWTAVETYPMNSFLNGTYSTKSHTFDGTTEYYVRFHCNNTTAVRYVDDVTITYQTAASTVAAPTFDPEDGTEFGDEGLSVAISCETAGASIYYTLNGDIPNSQSTLYEGTISLTETTTINAIAYLDGDASIVATATYIYVDPNAPGTQNNPYTVAQARAAIDAGTGTQGVYATGIVSAIPTAWSNDFNNITFNFVDNEGDNDFLQAYRCASGTGVDASQVAVGDVVVVYGNLIKYNSTYEFGQGCQLVSLTHPVITTPVVTVTPNTINAPAEGADGTLALTYENIEEFISFDYYFCDANGNELEDTDPDYPGDWIYAEINDENDVYTLDYIIDANQGEARTAYIKVYTFDDETEEVYDIVTVNQEEYVAPSYAELPFAFNSGRAAIEETDGLYQEGLGTDYNASTNPNTQLKFDGTGDWLLLQFNERPGTLTFAIKGNSFSGGTFKVQTSEDGTTYTDLATYSEFGSNVQNEEFTDLGENVRYIKWIYTNKDAGNVGLGNIALAEYVEPVIVPSITVTPAMVEVDAEEHDGTLDLAYENLEISGMSDFAIQYYDAEGEETETPDWIEVLVAEQNPEIGEGYVVSYFMLENEGEARSAYFKVFVAGDDDFVYSNLVTINQEAYVAPALDYATLPFEFNGGKADIEGTDGLTAEGLGTDYNANTNPTTKLKFDGTGDWMILHFNEAPGTLTFDIKGNGFSGGTFTVQTSEDGETYEELAAYTELGDVETMTFADLDENVRYIKWVYTEKVSGNVGLGNIHLYEMGGGPVLPASITVAPATVNATYEETEGTLTVTYENISDVVAEVNFCDAEGEAATYDWILADIDDENNVYYVIDANEGEARTAYLKVSALDDNTEIVYSNLVTINQEAYVAPIETEDYAVFTGDLIEGDYLIVYNGYAMNNVVTSGRLQYEEVEPENDVISTNDAAIVWHIARNDEGYWTIYSAAANAYAAGTGVKNKAQMLEDGTNDLALWTVEGLETFEFVNKGNSEANVNANLRNNGAYGFACYSTSIGGALTLYKKVTTTASYTLNITGYQGNEGGYYLIASPVYGLNPANVEGMLEGEFDLYAFDQAQNDQEWRNYKAGAFQYLSPGRGYLYAHYTDVELTFTGMPYEGNGEVALDYVEGVNLTGWNLIGNPYEQDARLAVRTENGYSTMEFYVMNQNGDDFELAERSVVHYMEGVLVEATAANQFACFSDDLGPWGGDPIVKINIRVSDENGKGDFARIRFGEGNNLEKFMLNPENTKIYFPVDGEEYAVVYADNMGEMPLNFSAAADGTYTLNINPEDMEMEYLHLIDNMTGMDVDLLANPTYSFEATTNDNAARFTLVFASLTGIEENSDNFAFFSNGNVIVSNEGNAMLQVVDMNGRIVKSENINGTTSVSVEAAPGVYMLRLVNGDNMKVQKIVVR